MKNSAFMPDARTHFNRLQCKTSDDKWLQLLLFQNRPAHDFSTLQKKMNSDYSNVGPTFIRKENVALTVSGFLLSANMNAYTPTRKTTIISHSPQYISFHSIQGVASFHAAITHFDVAWSYLNVHKPNWKSRKSIECWRDNKQEIDSMSALTQAGQNKWMQKKNKITKACKPSWVWCISPPACRARWSVHWRSARHWSL